MIDSLVISEESEALFLEAESESPAVARILGSTLIARGNSDAVSSIQEAGDGPALVSLRNSIVRHLPASEKAPPVDFYANGGTVVAEFSNYNTSLEENGGTVTPAGSGTNVAGDPQFVDPSLEIFLLQNASPLIDRGDAAVVQAGELDLLGSARSLDGNRDCVAAPDLGAFEVTGQSVPCPVDPPPTISQFGMSPKTFAVSGKGTKSSSASAAAAKVKRGTRFTYTLSEPAKVVIAIDRKAKGRRAGKKCVKVTPANRSHKPCTRFVRKGTLSTQEQAGRQSLNWSGRLKGKALKPGRYRARAVAVDASGQRSKPRSVGFKIVAG